MSRNHWRDARPYSRLPTLSAAEVLTSPSRAATEAFLWRSGFSELCRQTHLDRELWLASYVATYLERDVRPVLNVGDLRALDRLVRAAALQARQMVRTAQPSTTLRPRTRMPSASG